MIVTALNASMNMMIWGEKNVSRYPLSSAHRIEKVLTPDMALVAAKERVAL